MALFFLMLQLHRYIWALLTLALCFMTREDTMACAAILGLLAWRRNHRVLAIGALGVILFGMAFGSWCLRSGHTNIHGLPDFCYLALKLPYNFLKNVLGCSIWTNVLTGVGEPFLKFTLPHCLQWGGDREIGLCYPEAGRPLFTLISLLSLFGSGPLILWANRRMKLWSDDHPLMVQLVFIYGLCVYFLGTSLGDWVDRLIGHSWPLFWICIPYLLAKRQPPFRIKETRALVLSLIIIAWLPSLLNYSRYASNLWALATLTILVIAYVFAAKQLRKIPNREVST